MIQLHDLTLATRQGATRFPELDAKAEGIACIGAAGALCRALLEPELIQAGHILFDGKIISRALREGCLAYAPPRLPLDSQQRVGVSLANLHVKAGGLKRQVEAIFEVWEFGRILKCRPGQLSQLEHRKAAWIFALISQPQLFVFEDPFEGLVEADAQEFFEFAQHLLDQQKWLGSLSGSGILSRSLIRKANQVLELHRGCDATLCAAFEWPPKNYWLIVDEKNNLQIHFKEESLKIEGASLPGRFLIQKKDLAQAIKICTERLIPIQSYFPADEGISNMLEVSRVTR